MKVVPVTYRHGPVASDTDEQVFDYLIINQLSQVSRLFYNRDRI